MKKKLEWGNLKDGFCPNCYLELNDLDDEEVWLIKCEACGFSIYRTRYNEILEDMAKEEAGNNAENA